MMTRYVELFKKMLVDLKKKKEQVHWKTRKDGEKIPYSDKDGYEIIFKNGEAKEVSKKEKKNEE